MNPLIIYHANCWDGFGAAWAAWLTFGDQADYLPMRYGEPFPADAHGRVIYVLDFSWPYAALQEVFTKGIRPLQIEVHDHHKTARDDAQEYDPLMAMTRNEPALAYHFDMDKSGAVLAWERFHQELVPTLLAYVQDRDLWKFSLHKSREVSAWLRSYPCAFDTWNTLSAILDAEPSLVFIEGGAILRAQQEEVNTMCDHAKWLEIGGYRVPVANATILYSEIGEELCRRFPEALFSAYYMDRADGKRQWGLRSRGDFDVSVVAKDYGGGGHRSAAGFVEDLPAEITVLGQRISGLERDIALMKSAPLSSEKGYL